MAAVNPVWLWSVEWVPTQLRGMHEGGDNKFCLGRDQYLKKKKKTCSQGKNNKKNKLKVPVINTQLQLAQNNKWFF